MLNLRAEIVDDVDRLSLKIESIWYQYKEQGQNIGLYKLTYLTIREQLNVVFIYLFFNVVFRLLYTFLMDLPSDV